MRTKNPITVLGPDGRPLAGAQVYTRDRGTGADATVFAAESGAGAGVNPVLTGIDGRPLSAQWCERGRYASTITPPVGVVLDPAVEPWESSPGATGAIDSGWYADGSVTAAKAAADMATQGELDAHAALAAAAHPRPIVTVLPTGGLSDGMEVLLRSAAMSTLSVPPWRMRYDEALSKWRPIGACPLFQEINTEENQAASIFFQDLATVGPQVTIPAAGDYMIEWGALVDLLSNAPSYRGLVAVKRGAAATVDVDAAIANKFLPNGTSQHIPVIRRGAIFTGLAAGAVLKMQYRCDAPLALGFRDRYLLATPLLLSS